jgi:hypothetical protein
VGLRKHLARHHSRLLAIEKVDLHADLAIAHAISGNVGSIVGPGGWWLMDRGRTRLVTDVRVRKFR